MLLGSLVQSVGNDDVAAYAANYSKLTLFNKKRIMLQMFNSGIELFPRLKTAHQDEFYNSACTLSYPVISFYGIQITVLLGKSTSIVTCLQDIPKKNMTFFSIVNANTMDQAKNATRVMFDKYTGRKDITPIMIEQEIKNKEKKYKVINTGIAILLP